MSVIYNFASKSYGAAIRGYGELQKNIFKTRAFLPLSVRIYLTYRCNCVCPFCNAHFPDKEEMTLNDLERILKQIPEGTVILFSGGEITLLKDFLPMMKLATRHHKVQIFTSGSTLNKNKGMIEELVDDGLWVITFSVDVPNDTHNKIRGPEGLLQNIVEAVKQIKRIRKERRLSKPLIQINSVILKESIPLLPEMVNFSIDLGVDYMSFGGLDTKNYDDNDWDCFRMKFPMAMEIARKSKLPVKCGADVAMAYQALKDHPGSFKAGSAKERIRMSNFACLVPWTILMIEPNGTAHMCRDGVANAMGRANGWGMNGSCSDGMSKYNGSLGTLGNIKNTSLKELWNNQTAQDWRKSIIEMKELPPSCLNCCLITRVR